MKGRCAALPLVRAFAHSLAETDFIDIRTETMSAAAEMVAQIALAIAPKRARGVDVYEHDGPIPQP